MITPFGDHDRTANRFERGGDIIDELRVALFVLRESRVDRGHRELRRSVRRRK